MNNGIESGDGVCIYEVKSGDSLSAIAVHFGYVTPTQIARINHLPVLGCGLPPVFPGQRLIIPASSRALANTSNRTIPGMALPVDAIASESRKSSGDPEEISVNPFFYASPVVRAVSKLESSDDDALEQQFVKVTSQRLLSETHELIDGILLVTPESVCFDACRTAIAQKQAYLASHNLSTSLNETVDSEDSNFHSEIPQELLSLGLCVPLKSITSMSTLKESEVHIPSKSNDVGVNQLSDTESNHSFPDPVSHDASPDNGQSQATINGNDSESTNDIAVNRECINNGDTASHFCADNIQVQTIVKTGTNSSQAAEANDTSPTVITASNKSALSVVNDHVTQVKDISHLYLQITVNENGEHLFGINSDDLAKVCSFLLRAGISSSKGNKVESATRTDNHTDLLSESLPTPTVTEHRRSMVEEVLENIEQSTPIPILIDGISGILSEKMLEDLGTNIPTHLLGCNLSLIFKAEDDGYCLNTMYRKCQNLTGTLLLLIRDTMHLVFGAVLSDTIKRSSQFYGTGETYVFHWDPDFKQYMWGMKNYFFMRGSVKSFQIGGQSGRNAIWFDESLKYGRSESTDTFDNPVLCGNLPVSRFESSVDESATRQTICQDRSTPSPTKTTRVNSSNSAPFIIDTLEVWHFVS